MAQDAEAVATRGNAGSLEGGDQVEEAHSGGVEEGHKAVDEEEAAVHMVTGVAERMMNVKEDTEVHSLDAEGTESPGGGRGSWAG